MSDYLMTLWAGGGNVPPQLLVAKRLARRGHRVRIVAPAALRAGIAAAGAAYVPYRRAPEHDCSRPESDLIRDWEARGLAAAERGRDRLVYGTAEAIARDLLDAIAAERPDVLVTDYLLLGAYVAGERAAVPTVGLIHSVYPLPAPGIPPRGTGARPACGPLGMLRDAVLGRLMLRFFDGPLPRLNRVRADLGLPPLRSALQLLMGARRLLVLTSAAFDYPSSLPGNVRYVGVQADPDLPPTTPRAGPATGTPLVLVSLSTTFQDQAALLRKILQALGTLPVRGLVTLGPAMTELALDAPANVELSAWVPHERILPEVDLVVTHAGHGTVMAALRHGVPVLCLPMGRDQRDVAARAAWHGAGVIGSAADSVEKLRRRIAGAVRDRALRDHARLLAVSMARDDPDAAARELEGVGTSFQDGGVTGDHHYWDAPYHRDAAPPGTME
jgi:UDP:flavonoid glycosyltransferase YjiC (YdhE family)